jgi:hypothetical protein
MHLKGVESFSGKSFTGSRPKLSVVHIRIIKFFGFLVNFKKSKFPEKLLTDGLIKQKTEKVWQNITRKIEITEKIMGNYFLTKNIYYQNIFQQNIF